MAKKEKSDLVGKLIRYIANFLLVVSLIYFFTSLIFGGLPVLNHVVFWVTLIALWQVVIMLILVENFYLKK